MGADWKPLKDWEPSANEVVVDRRRETDGRQGVVVAVDRYGHVGDPYWIAAVRWADGRPERQVNTVWLVRPDGTQGAASNGGDQ